MGVGQGAGIVLAMAASKTKLEMQLGSGVLNSRAPQVEGTGNIAIDALLPRSVRSRRN